MNWKEIKEKYPKAYNKFHNQDIWPDYLSDLLFDEFYHYVNNHQYNNRDLYDFFDEREIIVDVSYNDMNSYWSFDVIRLYPYGNHGVKSDCGLWVNEKPPYFNAQPTYFNRKQAEEQAFMKAFEIFEEQL